MEKVIEKWGGFEVSPMDLYRDMFHLGQGLIQREWEVSDELKANPIILGSNGKKLIRRIMFEDTFESLLAEFQDFEWAYLNGISYWGRENTSAAQHKMYAMIFDLDGVTPKTLNNFFSGAFDGGFYPIPQYIVLSGHGVHLYYVFEEPLSLYPEVKRQLKNLKYALTDRLWNRYTSTDEKVQHQGINQGFRIAGGKTKDGKGRVRVFRVDQHPTSIEYLNYFVTKEFKVDPNRAYAESKMSLEEASKKYPEWYERRILGHEPRGRWFVKRDLYDWWKAKIQDVEDGAKYGRRYFCVMCLAIYGVKCGLDEKEVLADAMSMIPFLTALNPEEPFRKTDVESAMECFDEKFVRFPRNDVSKLSGIFLKENKRNGRTQDKHLQGARAIRDINNENWREGNGRPSKKELVREYAETHPGAKQVQIAAALGVSRQTVAKWLKEEA